MGGEAKIKTEQGKQKEKKSCTKKFGKKIRAETFQ
jgi:hypothetical protein